MNRRAVLLSTLAFAMAKPAHARPPFTLSGDPVPLPSPPFKDGEGVAFCRLTLRGAFVAEHLGHVVPTFERSGDRRRGFESKLLEMLAKSGVCHRTARHLGNAD